MKKEWIKEIFFYGGMISFAVGLFSAVTAYGEPNLQAAPSIKGEYHLSFEDPSLCAQVNSKLKTESSLVLSLQQSGIYLYADLTESNAESHGLSSDKGKSSDKTIATKSQSKSNLEGFLRDRYQVLLSASPSTLPECLQSALLSNLGTQQVSAVILSGKFIDSTELQGQIKLEPSLQSISFSATRLETQPTQSSSTH